MAYMLETKTKAFFLTSVESSCAKTSNLRKYLQVCSDVRSNSESSNYWHLDVPICTPSSTMYVNVSYETAIISLHPSLRYPYLQNIRVEVAGQVLSQGGNVGADQIADTSDIITERYFLPNISTRL